MLLLEIWTSSIDPSKGQEDRRDGALGHILTSMGMRLMNTISSTTWMIWCSFVRLKNSWKMWRRPQWNKACGDGTSCWWQCKGVLQWCIAQDDSGPAHGLVANGLGKLNSMKMWIESHLEPRWRWCSTDLLDYNTIFNCWNVWRLVWSPMQRIRNVCQQWLATLLWSHWMSMNVQEKEESNTKLRRPIHSPSHRHML